MKTQINIRALLLLLVMMLASTTAKAQWKEIQTGVSESLLDICCIDTNTVFACGRNGVILKTVDSGETWTQQNSGTTNPLEMLVFADENHGFALGQETLIKTVDGGATWTTVENDLLSIDFNCRRPCLFPIDANTLYLADGHNRIWKSTDGGDSFELLLDMEDTMEYFWKFDMYFEDNIGYLVGYDAAAWSYPGFGFHLTVFKTTDFGQTWEELLFEQFECALAAVHFTDKDNIRLFGYFSETPNNYYGVLETSDGFANVVLQQPLEYGSGFQDPLTNGRFVTFCNNVGCTVFNLVLLEQPKSNLRSYAYLTQDHGMTWTSIPDGINWRNELLSVDGRDEVFYIASQHGYVYRTGTPETIYPYEPFGVKDEADLTVAFPNPTSSSVTVNASPQETVEVVDLQGKTLLSTQGKGDHTVLNLSEFAPGSYLVRISDHNGQYRVQKVVKQ